ncbi:biosynthetic peptidoglycan transglycosylase [Ruegeria atlantica]|uniref:Glycosyl transferase family 51 domain-containing protein n=1 Tax=Ruegeria atlantica TaxID=81569 RepID=A0ABX1WE58_9RHOB|nr:biosynthetic peptidoglycan transglycosylase [Ruegeria atlantica]NOD31585.1 hypothetical protein [Ruegeria atlantica]
MDTRYAPRLDLSIKRRLRALNWDLDQIVKEVQFDSHSTVWTASSVTLKSLDIDVVQMILLIEDRRFFRHLGFELRAIPRLMKRALKLQKPGGISTLDQQLVRIITNRRERTISRKIRETVLAAAINSWLSKDELLLSYLKRSYFGRGLIGLEAASKHLFKKEPDQLSTNEAAFIASLLARPIPGIVVDCLNDFNLLTAQRPEEYIGMARVCAPTWAIAVRARYLYTLKLFSDSKESRD